MELLVVFFILLIFVLIIRLFLNPLFFDPKIRLTELIKLLESKDEFFLSKRKLNRKDRQINPFILEKSLFKKISFSEIYYIIESYSEIKKVKKKYFLKLKKSNNFFGDRIIELKEF